MTGGPSNPLLVDTGQSWGRRWWQEHGQVQGLLSCPPPAGPAEDEPHHHCGSCPASGPPPWVGQKLRVCHVNPHLAPCPIPGSWQLATVTAAPTHKLRHVPLPGGEGRGGERPAGDQTDRPGPGLAPGLPASNCRLPLRARRLGTVATGHSCETAAEPRELRWRSRLHQGQGLGHTAALRGRCPHPTPQKRKPRPRSDVLRLPAAQLGSSCPALGWRPLAPLPLAGRSQPNKQADCKQVSQCQAVQPQEDS